MAIFEKWLKVGHNLFNIPSYQNLNKSEERNHTFNLCELVWGSFELLVIESKQYLPQRCFQWKISFYALNFKLADVNNMWGFGSYLYLGGN